MKTINSRSVNLLGAALLMAVASGGAAAATQVYEGLDNAFLAAGGSHPNADAARSAFEAAVNVLLVQTFDDLPAGSAPANLSGPFGASLNATASGYVNIADARGSFDTFPSNGKFLDALGGNGNTYYTFRFDIPTRALGFDISDASDWFADVRPASNLVVTLLTSHGTVELPMFSAISPHDIVNGSFGFFGVVSDAQDLRGFSISNPLGNPDADAIGIDNLSVNIEPVPLPASAWMLLSALGGVAGLRRRRRVAR